jgi:Tfp pilus assembly protein PilP
MLQGLNSSIESVRLLNLVVKSCNDNLDSVPSAMTKVRAEDTHSMQQLEAFQVSSTLHYCHACRQHGTEGKAYSSCIASLELPC